MTDFDAYLNIMAKRLTVPEPDDQLLEAFRVFDKEGKFEFLELHIPALGIYVYLCICRRYIGHTYIQGT